ncbi:MAG: class I SAM-dependent methyltransferase [Patescibacteria group bacterium]
MKSEKLKETYNKIARDWAIDHKRDDWWIAVTDQFLSMLPKGATILDIGCAQGWKSAYLASKGFSVTGIDFSEEMVLLAQKAFPKIPFKVWDLYDIEKLPGTFDCVFAQAVLLHVPKAEILEVMGKIKTKLNPGGLLYVAVKQLREGESDEEEVTEKDYGFEYTRFFSYFTQEAMEGYFKKLGFEIVLSKVTHSGRRSWIQIAGKRSF